MDNLIETVFSRCPVGTATEYAIKKGTLQKALLENGAKFCLLQTMDPSLHQVHFTQEWPLHFRDGGNIPPIWAQAQGDRSVLLGITYQKEHRGIYVRKDSDIRCIDDLKKKRLAVPVRKDAIIDFRYLTALYGLESALEFYGIPMEKVCIVKIPCNNIATKQLQGNNVDTLNKDSDFMTEDFQSVLAGKADAVFAQSIKAVRHDKAGILRNIMTPEEQSMIPNYNNNAVLLITCTKPFAYEHPDIVITYLKEVVRAARKIKEHPDDFLETAASGIYGATVEEFKASFDNRQLFERMPTLNKQSLALVDMRKKFLIKEGVISSEKDFDVSKWADPHFLEEAKREVEITG